MAEENNQVSGSDNTNNNSFFRDGMATWIVLGSLIILIVLLYESFQNIKCDNNAFTNAKDLLNIVLPLLGTWIGTILAFYFGSKNFEAANKSMQDSNKNLQDIVKTNATSDDKLKSTKVSDSGIATQLSDIYYNKNIIGKKDSEILIKTDLIDFIDTGKKGERLPIIDSGNILKYIIHKSTLTDFLYKFSTGVYPNLAAKTITTLTLDDAINNSDAETKDRFTRGAAFITKTATLFDANQQIVSDIYCQDVFVTETGKASEPIIGWITNNKIAELAKV